MLLVGVLAQAGPDLIFCWPSAGGKPSPGVHRAQAYLMEKIGLRPDCGMLSGREEGRRRERERS